MLELGSIFLAYSSVALGRRRLSIRSSKSDSLAAKIIFWAESFALSVSTPAALPFSIINDHHYHDQCHRQKDCNGAFHLGVGILQEIPVLWNGIYHALFWVREGSSETRLDADDIALRHGRQSRRVRLVRVDVHLQLVVRLDTDHNVAEN